MDEMWINLKSYFEIRAPEWFGAAILACWGLYLLLYPGVFQGPLREVWMGLGTLAVQEVWGFGAFFVGSTRLIALFINGQWGLTPLIRVMTSFCSVFVWFWVMVGFYRAGVQQPGFIIYGGLIVADMFSAFKAASDAYEIEAQKKLQQTGASGNVVDYPSGHQQRRG